MEHISMAVAPRALWSGPWWEKVAMGTVRQQLCDRYSCAGQDKGTEGAENCGLMPLQKYAREKKKCVMSPTFQQRLADTFLPQFQ